MADIDGNILAVGDTIEIAQMDDQTYARLVGLRGTVHEIPPEDHGESHNTQVFVILQDEQVPALSTQQAWVRKVE